MNRTLNILKCLLLMVMVGALIVPGAVAAAPLDTLTNSGAGQGSQHDIAFTLGKELPINGKIIIGFDPGFNITSFTNDSEVFVDGASLTGSYAWTKDLTTNEIIITRSGAGDAVPIDAQIAFTLGNITNPTTLGLKPIEVVTRTALGTFIELWTDTVKITAGPVTQFTLGTVSNRVAGTPFSVTVTAKDQFGNLNDTFSNESAVLSSTIGSISPNIMDNIHGIWVAGVWTGNNEEIYKTGTGTITATSGGITGTSNTFTVNPAVVDNIVIDNIASPKYDELPFTVTARAYDEYNNPNITYDGTVTISAVQNLSDSRSITAFNLTPRKFVAGVLSVTVKVDVTDPAVPQPTYYGASLLIGVPGLFNTSNLFNVSELPVDLVNSTVVAYPPVVPEDGVSTSTITVTVKNSITYEVIPGVTVSVASDRGANDTITTVNDVTGSDGMARFTIKSSKTGTANITAKVNDAYNLNQKASVYFGYDNKLHLAKDWNLVSVPRQLANSALSALSTTKVDRIYTYDAGNKNWKYAIYNKTSSTWNGTLTAIDDGKGYWMFASASDNVPIVLKEIDPLQTPPAYPLKAGWNLIGYTSMKLKPSMWFEDYIWPDLYYPTGNPMWVSAYEWTGSGFNQANPWEDEFNMVITRGYWIYLKDDANLVP